MSWGQDGLSLKNRCCPRGQRVRKYKITRRDHGPTLGITVHVPGCDFGMSKIWSVSLRIRSQCDDAIRRDDVMRRDGAMRRRYATIVRRESPGRTRSVRRYRRGFYHPETPIFGYPHGYPPGAITTGCMRPFVPRTNKNELTTTTPRISSHTRLGRKASSSSKASPHGLKGCRGRRTAFHIRTTMASTHRGPG